VSVVSWRSALAADSSRIGLWVVSASPIVAEIVGMSGADWILLDAEHSPNDVSVLLPQLQVLGAAPVFTVVRTPSRDRAAIGRILDAGARGIMVPMIESAEHAAEVAAAVRYPPAGTRGVGGGFARAARWNGISDYLEVADESISLIAQIETAAGIAALPEILDTPGFDGYFFGPADLAASMGLLGQPRHPDVQRAVLDGIALVRSRGRVAGVNAFAEADAKAYEQAGARLLAVGADVTLLGSGSVALVDRFRSTPRDPVARSEERR
jgi:4-hydroxy-2-oxoheptanedioate aldolase